MARFWLILVIVAVGLAGVWGLIMLGRKGPRGSTSGGPRVVVVSSVPALGLAAERLLGDDGEYRTLLKEGEDPVGYSPDAKAKELFKDARLLVVTGNEVDGWAVEAARKAGRGDISVIRMSDVMVYGVPPGGAGSSAATKPAPGETRTVDALGRAFVLLPDPYTAANTPAITGKELLWLDTLYAQLFINELSVRLKEQAPSQEKYIRDRLRLLSNNLITLHGQYDYRFGRLKSKKICVTDRVLEPLAKRYGLTLEVIACADTGEAGYTHGLPSGPVDQTDKRPVFSVLAPGVDAAAFKAAFGARQVVVINPMTDSTNVARPDFEVLCRHVLDEVYSRQVEAVGVGN